MTSADAWSYISSEDNPADVGTREDCIKRLNCSFPWLHGPEFLLQESLQPCHSPVMVRRLRASEGLLVEQCTGLDLLINAAPSLYVLKKRVAYLSLFKLWIIAKYKRIAFTKPVINAKLLECAFLDTVRYVQAQRFGAAVEMLKMDSSDAFDSILKKLNDRADNAEDMWRISELKTLRRLRPCVDADSMLRIDGRLENADLPVDAKHPLILPGRHALTRLIILHEHAEAGHAGPSYTLMRTHQHFWIIHGVSSIKYYLSHCSACARHNATPIRQLMADLPACRVTATNKPFKYCGVDYFGPYVYRQGRSDCKAWGLLFTCLCTRAIHVELVTSLDLTSFLLAFSRFVNLRGAVDTMFSDNGSTFKAAAQQLPSLLSSPELSAALCKRSINWIFTPPHAPSQGGSWESMVKL